MAVPLAFFSTTAYGVLNFILLARKWPKLMQHWESVESALPPYTKAAQKERLGRKIRTLSAIVLSVALGILQHVKLKCSSKYELFNFIHFLYS